MGQKSKPDNFTSIMHKVVIKILQGSAVTKTMLGGLTIIISYISGLLFWQTLYIKSVPFIY